MQKQLSAQLRTNFLILLITAKIPEKYPSNLLRNKAIRFVPASCSVVHHATIRMDKAPLRPRSSHGTGGLLLGSMITHNPRISRAPAP